MPLELEEHDELGLPWDAWADGRIHRLVKGRDFMRGSDEVQAAAENAALRLNKVARTINDFRHGKVYVWVQFVDHQIRPGEPCPCGSAELLQISRRYAECARCSATLALVEPKRKRARSRRGGAPLLKTLVGGSPRERGQVLSAGAQGEQLAKVPGSRSSEPVPAGAAPAGLRRDRVAPSLTAFKSVNLFVHSRGPGRQRFYGYARKRKGEMECLVVVDFPLLGERLVAGLGDPFGWEHSLSFVPAEPFGPMIDLDRLRSQEPDVTIEDPLGGRGIPTAAMSLEGSAEGPEAFADLELRLASRSGSKETYYGRGRTKEGEPVLVFARYRAASSKDRKQRETSPLDGRRPVLLRSVPLEPFRPFVRSDALMEPVDRPSVA